MFFTIAICTWNRCASLQQTLRCLADLDLAGLRTEVLVVDNGSTDDTAAVAREAAAMLPIRVVTEPVLGVAHARNTAVRESRGDLIAWTDDDVLVERGWLQAYARAAARWPTAGFFGGPIRALFPREPPDWLTASWYRIGGAFAVRDLGQMPFVFEERCVPFSANLVVRTDVMRRYPFDPRLGLRGFKRVGGEETPVLRAMIADRIRGWWVPDASVQHVISPERMTLAYVARFYTALGVERRLRDGTAHIPGCAPWVWVLASEAEREYRASRAVDPPEVWMPKLLRACLTRGRMLGLSGVEQ